MSAYYNYLKLMKTLLSLKKPSVSSKVHTTARVYKTVAATTQALNKLVRLGYADKEHTGRRRYEYSLRYEGKALLKLKEQTQFKHLARKEHILNQGDKCCVCGETEDLTLFQRKLFCPRHLNADFDVPIPRMRIASILDFA